MDYYFSMLLFLLGFFFLFFTLFMLSSLYKHMRNKQFENLPFLPEYTETLERISHYKKLSKEDQENIQKSILRFMNSKEFIGVHCTITDEMRLVISFYACLLLLHVSSHNCYDNLETIIVYPNTIITKETRSNGGIYTQERFLLEGQSTSDTVVISWHEAKKEAYHPRHHNVIIHEFAHEIDFMDGEIDGIPPLEASKYDIWARSLHRNFTSLAKVVQKNRDWGKYRLFGEYASTNEAEFFAVATELFFEKPDSLKQKFPDIYHELLDFYKIEFLT